MQIDPLVKDYPARWLKPVDGMAVTAGVWEQAHAYHREALRSHAALAHQAGILSGLEVIASDPPDSSVYVLPGVALDRQGRAIVVQQPTAFDLGAAQGPLFLVLTYVESRPRADADGVPYAYIEFGLEVKPELPDEPCIELARIRRQGARAPLTDAKDPRHPGDNAIDLRHRLDLRLQADAAATAAVCYAGQAADLAAHGGGIDQLARALRRNAHVRLAVDTGVPLSDALLPYTLVCLVGGGRFELSRDQMTAIWNYWKGGGTLLYESCRRGISGEPPPGDAAFLDLVSSFGVKLAPLPQDHPLLREPNLFGAVPPGYDGGAPKLMIADGVIFSTADYGCLWSGAQKAGPASREAIRSAMEWGENLVNLASARREAQPPAAKA